MHTKARRFRIWFFMFTRFSSAKAPELHTPAELLPSRFRFLHSYPFDTIAIGTRREQTNCQTNNTLYDKVLRKSKTNEEANNHQMIIANNNNFEPIYSLQSIRSMESELVSNDLWIVLKATTSTV